MSDMLQDNWRISDSSLRSLIRRCGLSKQLLRRVIEEDITKLVFPDLSPTDELLADFYQQNKIAAGSQEELSVWLQNRGWSQSDLNLHLLRPLAITRFIEQRYGPGIEEVFLARKDDLDTVIYSLLRVKDPGLAREIWISLSENEATFAELSSRFSDGPEAKTKGVIGPLPLGSIEPAVADRLRSLRLHQLRPPEALGSWYVLLRLESLTPARLDQPTRGKLRNEQFESWINDRVNAILVGETPDSLHFDPDA